jgi:pimeloyl-ACP methyl ester carboxylesterase
MSRRVLIGLVAVTIVAALVFRVWVAAQARALIVISTTIPTPVVSWSIRVLTPEPRVQEMRVGGLPSTLVLPGSGGPWPALVFVNGATRLGRHHPDVKRLARGLARAGYLVLVPDLPGLSRGEITDRTVAATVAAATALADRPDARASRVGFVAVSVGASLALLAAEHPRLARRVFLVAGIAPYADLENVVRLATTGTYRERAFTRRYERDDYLPIAVGRSLAAALRPGPDRRQLVKAMNALDDETSDPLSGFGVQPRGAEARAVASLLANRDPNRFDILYGRLSSRLRRAVVRLSPIAGAQRLRARVELATGPEDKYFPPAESRALVRAAPHVHLTVTSTLDHAIPEPSLGAIGDLARFDAFVVRALRHASA